jgi:hypothetical protein
MQAGDGRLPTYKVEADEQTIEWETKDNEDGSLTITKYLGKSLDVTIPSLLNGEKVKSIEGKIGSLNINVLFQNRNRVQSITIEEGVEVVGERAFLEYGNLTSLVIPKSVTKIGKEAFLDCKSLTTLVFPEGVVEIGERAFQNCYSLSSVQIPSSVTKIEDNAFASIDYWRDTDGLPDLVIHSPKGSYAIEYAKENGIKYVEM